MRKWLKRILWFLVVVLVLIQFVPVKRTNPPEDATRTLEARAPIPPPVKAVLDRACLDCHSNRTRWPWYSGVAPVSWLVIHDTNEGRSELNLSEWPKDPLREAKKLRELCDEVTSGDMPLWQYVLIHRDAALTQAERESLCQWAKGTAVRLNLPPPPPRKNKK